ncbi:hypothetical protein [Amycolatopsis sp. NPDC059657]|uniref:hypothetical protein n=1 Tax=Amycolatopsis sp. NPDC059657 TaxID=3346899 RepID=UPI00367247F3
MIKKIAAAALIAFVATTTMSVPASAEAKGSPVAVQGFVVLKEKSGNGRTLRLWKNTSNGMVHANASGARYGDKLSIGSCCYPYTTYETVTSTGNSELNTGEYTNSGPSVNLNFAGGGEIHF